MIIFGGSCEQCDFNSSCSHQKLLWDGKEFRNQQALCRTLNGLTYYYKGYETIPSEPQDWWLWGQAGEKKQGITIYGREQFIRPDIVCDNNSDISLPVPKVVEEVKVHLKPGPLKSVYADLSNTQGSLF